MNHYVEIPVCLNTIKNGTYFKRKEDSKKVYIKSDFNRDTKKYSCIDFDDTSHVIALNGSSLVYVDFEF